MGVVAFLSFMAVVSVSLGVLNLLPVPVLDGGHLFYYGVEALKGSPLSERAQEAGQRVGLTMLVLLMGLAFYNEMGRASCRARLFQLVLIPVVAVSFKQK